MDNRLLIVRISLVAVAAICAFGYLISLAFEANKVKSDVVVSAESAIVSSEALPVTAGKKVTLETSQLALFNSEGGQVEILYGGVASVTEDGSYLINLQKITSKPSAVSATFTVKADTEITAFGVKLKIVNVNQKENTITVVQQ